MNLKKSWMLRRVNISDQASSASDSGVEPGLLFIELNYKGCLTICQCRAASLI